MDRTRSKKQLIRFMKHTLLFILLLTTTLILNSCYYDNFKELHPETKAEDTSGCDTTSGIKYSVDIEPIFAANCISCHNGVSNTDLTTVAGIKASYSGNKLYNAISNVNAVSPMPPTGPLPNSDVTKIKQWIDACQPNN